MANENTILASANDGRYHLAVMKMRITKRLGRGATSEARWNNRTPRRERTVYVIRYGITEQGLAAGGCDCTHAISEEEARAEWAEFLTRKNTLNPGTLVEDAAPVGR